MVWSPLVVFTASHLDGHGHYQCQLWRWARPKWQLIEANVVLRRSRMQAFCPKCLLFFSLFCVILEQIRSKQLSCSPTCAAALFSDSVLISRPHSTLNSKITKSDGRGHAKSSPKSVSNNQSFFPVKSLCLLLVCIWHILFWRDFPSFFAFKTKTDNNVGFWI